MTAAEIRKKYLEFFQSKGHKIIPSASLVPANDPTILFTTAGMHPLVPYLLGQNHPEGKRLTSVQKCLRTDDIDEVGDDTHLTFFEMLGNWSLGDYWKDEAIAWSYEFLTDKKYLGLDKSRLAVSVFAGDSDAPKDEESVKIWKSLGFEDNRIAFLPKKDNWWGPPGATGPCGPDTEMFYWTGDDEVPDNFQETHDDTHWVEIWNDVFMQYQKNASGQFEPLKQRNVDTGMGLERVSAVLENKPNIFETSLFVPIIEKIQTLKKHESPYKTRAVRVIADHMRATVFLLANGVTPSNKDRGYILRRLIRRAITNGRKFNMPNFSMQQIAGVIISQYRDAYPELEIAKETILSEIKKEEEKFQGTLDSGVKALEKIFLHNKQVDEVNGKQLFDIYQTYGVPIEVSNEIIMGWGIQLPDTILSEAQGEFKKHQELSRTASAGQFKGGLSDHSDKVVRLHTATHLLNAALRKVLGENVWQKGSNITTERTRFDFTHDKKLTDDEKAEVEWLVNDWISQDLQVKNETMPLEEARKLGAIGVFGEKYPEVVSVYTIYKPQTNEVVSAEFCGGPHVTHTGIIGKFKIQKEEAVSAGVRRIKATIE